MTKQALNLFSPDSGKTLFLYDIIGDWWTGATADIITQVIEAAQESITVRIHSYGGNADDGIAVYNALRRAAARGVAVTTTNDGAAYSAASIIFMAGDVRRAAANSTTMVHAAYLSGDDATETDLKRLDILNAAIAQIYTERSGADADTVAAWMSQDTWFSASDALALGLATEIESLAAVAALAEPLYANWTTEQQKGKKKMEPTNTPPSPVVPPVIPPTENKVVIDPATLAKLTADYGAQLAVAALSAGGGELEAAKLALAAKAEAEKAQAAKLAKLEAEVVKLKAVPAPPPSASPVAPNLENKKSGGTFLAAIRKNK